MRRIDAGTSGTECRATGPTWRDLKLGDFWLDVITILAPGPMPREAQSIALGKQRVLEHRRNIIISAPTNGGKSLIGLLILLETIDRGQRAVLIEPLRAIAREKGDELKLVASRLSTVLGRPLTIRISTGDYRLDSETLSSPPPDQGEIIIATPERFEAILRNPEYDTWVRSIGAVCVDEAHLIGSPRRGTTLEYLLTFLLCLPAPPRLTLLSATLGNSKRLREWLSPCDVISVTERQPPLCKEVIELSPDEDASEVAAEYAKSILVDASANVLIFVYQTKSAVRLATILRESVGELAGTEGPLAYHAQMRLGQREAVRASFRSGRCRCVVATTALGLGVNLPTTHVIVRDNTFPGAGALSVSDLLQMIGRAGRGNRAGYGAIIVRPTDYWNAKELANALQSERVLDLVSSFEQSPHRYGRRGDISEVENVATCVTAHLSRYRDTGRSIQELRTFFKNSLAGERLAEQVPSSLAWLSDPAHVLAYEDESGKHRLTSLGQTATMSVLPLRLTAGLAQLIRDLLTVDPSDQLLGGWRDLDFLIILSLLSDRTPALRVFSANLIDQVDAWMEKYPSHTPLLYKQWISGQQGASRAIEVLGSLGVLQPSKPSNIAESARREAYVATLHSILIFERGNGVSIEDIKRQWKVNGLDGIEERWRDDYLWLLSGIARILDLRCFYFHLREECKADKDRVQRVKRLLRNMQIQAFHLQQHLKYCSPLGSLVRSIRRAKRSDHKTAIGIHSIRRLEDIGIRSLSELAQLKTKDLKELGIRPDVVRQIRMYVRQRFQ